MRMKPQKIVFLGLFGQQNLGNECTLQAMIYHVRKYFPGADLKCICTGPEDTRTRHGIPAFEMFTPAIEINRPIKNPVLKTLHKIALRAQRELRHGVKAFLFLKGSDLLVAPGTGLLVDHTTGFRGYPFFVFKWALIARLCGCKFLIVSIGAGPIDHPLSKLLIKGALLLATYRSYRDIFSKEYIEKIGFVARIDPIYPDLAFSLPENTINKACPRNKSQTIVGVGLVDYYGQGHKQRRKGRAVYDEYINKMGSFLLWLLANNYRVRLLIGDMKYDQSPKQDVLEYINKYKRNQENIGVINEPVETVEDLMAQLLETDIVISPRYHNIILSLMLNKPAISLSYNEKFEALMFEFGMEKYCQWLDELDIDKLKSQLITLEIEQDSLITSIGRKCEEYRKALDDQYDMIFQEWALLRKRRLKI
jgi:polysaccharide pyruvyl transferase WcaK-like protein